ncbi:MAG: (2Fe-2S)-binding protein [Verrucomicrobia bacterium]|nr:MAG: (2Fe-2S)-binding protein [Verrucomicrobiota bacterium]
MNKVASVPAVFRKTADTFAAGAKTLRQQYFASAEIFRREQEQIFAKQWLVVGHQSQIADPGDYFLVSIPPSSGYGATGESLIVIRDKEVPGFEKADYSLRAVNLALWEGFIFINLDEDAMSLDEWFAPLNGKFSHWNMSILRPAKRIDYDVKANWKLMFENYSECYHCPGVHPMLAKVSPYDSAQNDLSEGPFLGGFMKINKGAGLTMSGKACALPVGGIKRGDGEEGEDDGLVFYYSIFPNMLLSLHPEYVMVHQLWPKSPERTLILCDWFFHPEAAAAGDRGYKYNPNDAIEFWDMTNKQDWHVCELSQQGIASRAYEPGPYSSRESIPAAWDRYYRSMMH